MGEASVRSAGFEPPLVHDVVLDSLADVVREELGVPVALVSLVLPHLDRQDLAGLSGALPDPYATARQTPLTHSFCRYVVHDRRPLVIDDARHDERLRDNPAVETLGVVSYAGYPVADAQGMVVGALCAIDGKPRQWTELELARLRSLAADATARLQEMDVAEARILPDPAPLSADPTDVGQRSRLLLRLSEDLAETLDVVDVARAVAAASTSHLTCLGARIWLRQTVIPRSMTGIPEAQSLDARTLCRIPLEDKEAIDTWGSSTLPLDESTPVGASAVRSEACFFNSRADIARSLERVEDLAETGERRAFLPLISHGRLFGTLALIWPDAGPISDAQRLTVGALASYTAQAVERASMRQDRIDALLTLQRSLMPSLPHSDEAELAARYLPASEQDQIGGDWYDARVPSPGALEVMIGDVMGHDIDAAASMGQFRTMLRVLAATAEDGPASQVARLDRAVSDLGIGGMATLIHGRLSHDVPQAPGSWRFVWTNAGHPPPLVLPPEGAIEVLQRSPADVFIGVMPDRERHDHEHVLAPGSILFLYTDGIVERRGEDVLAGVQRLQAALTRRRGLPLEQLLDTVLHDLLQDRRDDDVAILACRLPEREG